MASDTSPPSGYRLETPGRTDGRPDAAASAQPQPPSWLTVIRTTLRLWLRRRILGVPDSGPVGQVRFGRFAVLAVSAVVIVAAGITTGLVVTAGSPGISQHHVSAPRRPALTPAQRAARQADAAAAARNTSAAADWIAAQIAPGTVIGCDPATCAAILQAGYPSGGQVVLQPGVSLPGPGSLIVASGTIRGQYGSQLATSAPAMIAVFGAGPQSVQVRVAVAGGAQGYQQAAGAALTARQRAGRGLLGRSRVHVSGASRVAIASGGLDPRLTAVLGRLAAARFSVDIAGLADAGPTPAIVLPYRSATVIVPTIRAGHRRISQLGAMEQLLRSQPAGYRPGLRTYRGPGGRTLLQLTFPAPTPF